MPHKRAKRSIRERKKTEAGSDLAPEKGVLSSEAIPKSVARVLNASKVQKEWKESKKRKDEDSGANGKPEHRSKRQKVNGDSVRDTPSMRILPGEPLAHFNRRVENSMRGLVRSAAQSASATARKVKKTEAAGHSDEPRTNDSSGSELKTKTISQYSDQQKPSNPSKRTRPEAFQTYSASAPRRLNDIVHAPPTLKTLPRKAKVTQESTQKRSLREGVLSMAQKAMLEEERERAIRLYREMKKR